ncbi:hypothetical protein [Shivajiella indica]|uniref:Glycine zipper family protein n=1 Tax=Shivajiella indica TaxID=872115 RepID=A0ABW5B242_9BACT
MDKFIILLIIMLTSPSLAFSQKAKQKPKDIYLVWVNKMDKSETIMGNLLDLGEDQIIMRTEGGTYLVIPVKEIRTLKFNEKDAAKKGAMRGGALGLAGAVIGGVVYLFSGEKSEDAGSEIGGFIAATVGLTAILAAYGAMQSSGKDSYLIKGRIDEYQKLRESLQRYVMKDEVIETGLEKTEHF